MENSGEIKNKSKHGGKRIGAGRPPKEVQGKRAIAEIRLLSALDDLWTEAVDAYRDLLRDRNPVIVRDYFDRKCGRPAQALTGPGGDALQIVISQAVINADSEVNFTENGLPVCIDGVDG